MKRVIALAAALLFPPTPAYCDMDAARALFMRGELPAGGKTQPCAGCHAADGGGRREGGVTAPAIQFDALADLTGGVDYDAAALATLLAEGTTPDGRSVDRTMPRLRVEATLAQDMIAQDMIALLKTLRESDSAGIDAQRIRIGALLSNPNDALPAALDAAVMRWSDGGRLYGRRIVIEPLDAEALRREAPRLFAVVGLTAAQRPLEQEIARAGGLNLFPRHPFAGDEDPDNNRGVLPDFPALGRALAAAAQNCADVAFSDEDAAAAPGVRESFRRQWTAAPEARGKCRIALIDATDTPLADDERLIAPLDVFAARLPALTARKAGATLIDLRPTGASADAPPRRADVERFADAAALTLVEGLTHASRRLTRARFMQALDALAVSPPDWQSLDYRQHRLSGAIGTATIRLGAAP